MAAGVNNLNLFSLDNQNKYDRCPNLLKPNPNTSYFQYGYQRVIFKLFKPNFWIMY